MDKLEEAVLLTKKYAAFFKSRLSDGELHRWLISDKICSQTTIKKLFPKETKIRPDHSEVKKFALARKVAKLLSFIPTVSSVAITGSLAINNSKPGDDIDLFIITRPDTLWITRLFVIPLVGLFFKRRLPANYHTPGVCEVDTPGVSFKDTICLNLWLDETAIAVPKDKRNLYTAHEVLQALPIYDRNGAYSRFIKQNNWTKKYLANAYQLALDQVLASYVSFRAKSRNPSGKRFLHALRLVGMTAVRLLNLLAFRFQYLYMKKRITHETVTLHSAYFHPRDLSHDLDTYLGV